MVIIRLISCLLLSLFIINVYCKCTWDNCNTGSDDPNTINVHLVPHTHDDLGWLKTVDQYYYGTNIVTLVGVQYIYNNVIQELLYDPSRRFSFAEAGFLWRWWISHEQKEQDQLRSLIQNGQLEIIGGGWTQNDEAAAHYVDVIDQMTLGLRTLSDFFGDCGKPLAAWQIDPFGHSREMASLFAQMGYTSLSFARLHYRERENRLKNRTMEMIWNASDDLKTSLFTGAFYKYDYNPPDGFCWDVTCWDEPIQDNPDLGDYNVDKRVEAFLDHVYKQRNASMTNHIMLLMGSDFHYTDANMWFVNMDKLIKYVNKGNAKVKVFYSTPSCYYQAVADAGKKAGVQWTTKDDDFFPYANWAPSYWTGYFTSRPAYKGMIRDASALLQLSKGLAALGNLGAADKKAVDIARMASGLAQHHDSVTGTAKQVVTYDYQMQLHRGMAQTQQVIGSFLSQLQGAANSINTSLCFIANETVCDATANQGKFQITVFNTRAKWANETIRIPYYFGQASVKDPDGKAVSSYLAKVFQIATIKSSSASPYELHFTVNIPPFGFTTYSIDNATSKSTVRAAKATKKVISTNNLDLENELIKLVFDNDGQLTQVVDKSSNSPHNLQQQFLYYYGMDNRPTKGGGDQPSGAYIFRPFNATPVNLGKPTQFEFVDGGIVKEARQQFGDWVYQTIRLVSGKPYVEFDWVVGPIPILSGNQNWSKEVITRYISSDIKNGGIFYTDSTGRQMLQRKRDFFPTFTTDDDETVARNYYPLTNRIFIKDDKTQMTVLLDRAEGGTGDNGMIELMLHRRCLHDDHYGVDEPLNEPGKDGKGLVVRGSHYIVFGDPKTAASVHRPLAVDLFHKPIVSYLAQGTNTQSIGRYSGLTDELPDNVHLLTLEQWSDTSILLRLEHIYQNGEDDTKSKPVTIDFGKLFSGFNVVSVKELMLGGNRNAPQSVDLINKRQLRVSKWKYSNADTSTPVTLNPMQIRTFEVTVNFNNAGSTGKSTLTTTPSMSMTTTVNGKATTNTQTMTLSTTQASAQPPTTTKSAKKIRISRSAIVSSINLMLLAYFNML